MVVVVVVVVGIMSYDDLNGEDDEVTEGCSKGRKVSGHLPTMGALPNIHQEQDR